MAQRDHAERERAPFPLFRCVAKKGENGLGRSWRAEPAEAAAAAPSLSPGDGGAAAASARMLNHGEKLPRSARLTDFIIFLHEYRDRIDEK